MKIMKIVYVILLFLVFYACTEKAPVEIGTSKALTEKQIGQPDSIVIKTGIPDVYTNKLINMEVWYYGLDTSIVFADDKIQTISIKK